MLLKGLGALWSFERKVASSEIPVYHVAGEEAGDEAGNVGRVNYVAGVGVAQVKWRSGHFSGVPILWRCWVLDAGCRYLCVSSASTEILTCFPVSIYLSQTSTLSVFPQTLSVCNYLC